VQIKDFYKNVLKSASKEESDNEIDLLIAAAAMVNDHYPMSPRTGGSSKKCLANIDRNQEAGHAPLQGLLRPN
jgi:hypothetical protein